MILGVSGKIGSGKDTVGQIIQYLTHLKKYPTDDAVQGAFKDWINHPHKDVNCYDWEIKKFANKLKDIVCLLIGCTREQLEDREFKEKELGEEWKKIHHNMMSHEELLTYLKFENSNESIQGLIDEGHCIDLGEGKYRITCLDSILTPRRILQLLGTEAGRQIIHPNIWVNSLMCDYISEPDENSTTKWKGSNWVITDMRFPNELEAVKSRGGITIRVERPGLVESNHLSETSLDSATFDFVINNDKDIEHLINEVRKILEKLSII